MQSSGKQGGGANAKTTERTEEREDERRGREDERFQISKFRGQVQSSEFKVRSSQSSIIGHECVPKYSSIVVAVGSCNDVAAAAGRCLCDSREVGLRWMHRHMCGGKRKQC